MSIKAKIKHLISQTITFISDMAIAASRLNETIDVKKIVADFFMYSSLLLLYLQNRLADAFLHWFAHSEVQSLNCLYRTYYCRYSLYVALQSGNNFRSLCGDTVNSINKKGRRKRWFCKGFASVILQRCFIVGRADTGMVFKKFAEEKLVTEVKLISYIANG